MRTLDASQTRQLSADALIIKLLTITTYTDRAALTGPQTIYLSEQQVTYDYGNTGTDQSFVPLLLPSDGLVDSINHLPGPRDQTSSRRFTINIENGTWQGERVIAILRQRNIVNAQIEMSKLTVDGPALDTYDFSSLTGNEHEVFFRGRIAQLGPISGERIQLQCETDFPELATFWQYANAPEVDPKDKGKRFPQIFGRKKRGPCIGRIVGWTTTLSEPFGGAFLGDALVSTAQGFPSSGTFEVRIGNEEMRANGNALNEPDEFITDAAVNTVLTIIERAINGTRSGPHAAGEVCIELIAKTVFTAAGHASSEVLEVYVENPVALGELVRLPAFWTADVADTTTDTFTTTTISMNTDALSRVLGNMFAEVDFTPPEADITVTQIPFDAVDDITSFDSEFKNDSNFTLDVNLSTWVGLAGDLGDPHSVQAFKDNLIPTIGTDEISTYRVFWTTSANLLQVTTAKLHMRVIGHNLPGFTAPVVLADHAFPDGESDFNAKSAVLTPPGGTVIDDFVNTTGSLLAPYVQFIGYNKGDDDIDLSDVIRVVASESGYEFTVIDNNIGVAEYSGATVGFGLNVFADIDGRLAPSSGYVATSGTLMTAQADLVRFWVEEIGGDTVNAADLTAAIANLGTNTFEVDLRQFGITWEQVIQRIAYESRSNIFPREVAAGREWRFLQAFSDYKWGDPTLFLDSHGEVTDTGRDIRTMGTHYTARYAIDSSLGTGEESYRGIRIANPTESDVSVTAAQLTIAEKQLGSIAARNIFFDGIRIQSTADEVFGYIVHEGIAGTRAIIGIRDVPWYVAYTLEVGDLAWVTPPWNEHTRQEMGLPVELGNSSSEDTVFPHDVIGDWVAGTGAAVAIITDPTSGGFPGTNVVLRAQSTGATETFPILVSDLAADADVTPASPRDVRGRAYSIFVFVPTVTHNAMHETDTAMSFVFGSGAGDTIEFQFPRDRFPDDTWIRFVIPMSDAPTVVVGTFDPSHCILVGYTPELLIAETGRNVYFKDGRFIDAPIRGRVIEVINEESTENSDVTVVEVPGREPIPALVPPAIPSTTRYVQQAKNVSTEGTTGLETRRPLLRDGRTTETLTDFDILVGGGSIDIEFDPPPIPIVGSQTIRIWANLTGTASVDSIQVGTSLGSGASVGSITVAQLENDRHFPVLYEFSAGPGDFVRLSSATFNGFGQQVNVFQVERVLEDIDAPADDTQSPNGTAAGDGADLDNAVDGDSGTFATMEDGEHVQVTFPAPGGGPYDAQLILIDSEKQGNGNALAVYLGDVRGGAPTDIVTSDSGEVDDLMSQQTTRGIHALYTSVNDNDVFIYGASLSTGGVRIYEVTRKLIRFPTQYQQLPLEAFGADLKPEQRFWGRTGSYTSSENMAGRFMFLTGGAAGNDIADIEFEAPPTAITTTQTIRFVMALFSSSDVSIDIRVGATQGTGSVVATIGPVSAPDSLKQIFYEVTTAATGNWVRFEAAGSGFPQTNNLEASLQSVDRLLPDTTTVTDEDQLPSTVTSSLTTKALAIDGDLSTFCSWFGENDPTPLDLKVTFPAPPGGAYQAQILQITMSHSQQAAGEKRFGIYGGAAKGGGGTALTDDDGEVEPSGNSNSVSTFTLYTTSTFEDFFFYCEGPGTFGNTNADDLRIHDVRRTLLRF